jgi:hypothetical protein
MTLKTRAETGDIGAKWRTNGTGFTNSHYALTTNGEANADL